MNKKLYAIWQDNQVKGYIALTQEQADKINRIPDVGLYVGGDAFAGNPRCDCWVYSPCTWTSEDGRTTFNVSKAPHCSECGRAVLMNNEMNGRFAYCPHLFGRRDAMKNEVFEIVNLLEALPTETLVKLLELSKTTLSEPKNVEAPRATSYQGWRQ